jgi:hypothetical protein
MGLVGDKRPLVRTVLPKSRRRAKVFLGPVAA